MSKILNNNWLTRINLLDDQYNYYLTISCISILIVLQNYLAMELIMDN